MTRRFFSGNTLDQAVMMAARHHELDPEDLAYRQIEKKHGFLRTRKAVMIEIDPENPRRQPGKAAGMEAGPVSGPAPAERVVPAREEAPAEARPSTPRPTPGARQPADEARADRGGEPHEAAPDAAPGPPPERDAGFDPEPTFEATAEERPPAPDPPAPRAPREPASEESDEELLGAAEESAQILMRFAGIDGEAAARWGEERVEVEIEGPDSSVLVVESGKGLLAIQHLLPRMMRGMTGRSTFVRVDSESFHQNRRERLQALAIKEAEAASRNGTPRTLPPMAPDERRLVHLAVKEIPAVETESRGTGLHKRVVIRPVVGDGGHDDIEARHGF